MTKTNTGKEILVYDHWLEMKEPMLMGSLYAKIISGKEIALSCSKNLHTSYSKYY